ncbi:hypothetical protein Tco_0106769 [Tanacetum coccineum]
MSKTNAPLVVAEQNQHTLYGVVAKPRWRRGGGDEGGEVVVVSWRLSHSSGDGGVRVAVAVTLVGMAAVVTPVG